MVISSCTASPEAIAICGSSFGTSSALRQAAPVAATAALSAGLLIGGRQVDSVSESVEVVGGATLVREPGQPSGALNPSAGMYGIYGIDKAALEALQDLLLSRLCQISNSDICQALYWQGFIGEFPGFSFGVPNDRGISLLNRIVTYPSGEVNYDIVFEDDGSGRPMAYASWQPWRLVNPAGDRAWASVDQATRDAAAALATPEEEWGIVKRKGTLGGLSYPPGYTPGSAEARANPASVQVSGTDRIFREPATIPGTSVLEQGGPLINERGNRRVGAGYPGSATNFQEGAGASVGSRGGTLTQSATGADGQTPAHNEKKVGFPLPGADGQLDSDDQVSQEQSDPCQAPCIQDILDNVLDIADWVSDLWEFTTDYAVEDYLLPEGNFRFSIEGTGHPKDQIVAACIIQSGPVPQWYGRYFDDSLWVSTLYPKNLGSMQFTYEGIADRLIGFENTSGLDLKLESPHTEIRSFNSLIFPSPDFPAKEISFQARAGLDCRLRVLVRRYQLPI